MSSDSKLVSIAFIGATGGCTNAALTYALKAGLKAVALARTPEKLTELLLSQGLDHTVLSNQLTIVKGTSTDVGAIKSILVPEVNNNVPVSLVISGIGGTPKFQASITQPLVLDQPTICEDSAKALVEAVKNLNDEGKAVKPVVVAISSAGISGEKTADAPGFLKPFNRYLLSAAHADKIQMEKNFADNSDLFKSVIILRPSWLNGTGKTDDSSNNKGYSKVRAGTQSEPAIGYFISRGDVGEWIYEEIIKSGGEKWFGEKVTLAI